MLGVGLSVPVVTMLLVSAMSGSSGGLSKNGDNIPVAGVRRDECGTASLSSAKVVEIDGGGNAGSSGGLSDELECDSDGS
jgi:hypothetical protein